MLTRNARSLRIAFFGSSLVSAYWNGAATYYRGILKALHARGHYEPDAYERQANRDLPSDPPYARVVVYPGDAPESSVSTLVGEAATDADVLIKASGVGVYDALLERLVLEARRPGLHVVFWDVDAPATLDRVHSDSSDPFLPLIPLYDAVLTYGGGEPVTSAYAALGAKRCVPIYNALDPETHHPVAPEPRFARDLAFLGNRLPDREARVEAFFLTPATALPGRRFLLGGSGWHGKPLPANVGYVGHVGTGEHNAFNSSPLAVLNVSRDSMARYGFSPATRVFEAAGAGACLITDWWTGLETFLEPGAEVLAARDGAEVAAHLAALTPERSVEIGQVALRRVLAEHTYARRAEVAEEVLFSCV